MHGLSKNLFPPLYVLITVIVTLLLCYEEVAVATLASTQTWSHVSIKVSKKPSDAIIQYYDTRRKICGIWFKYSGVTLVDLPMSVERT